MKNRFMQPKRHTATGGEKPSVNKAIRQTKVRDFHMMVSIEKKIFRFQISVDNSVAVAILNA